MKSLEDAKGDRDFQRTEIASLISDWENRAGGGDDLKLPELEDRGRRRSQDFTNLRQIFVEHSGGIGGDWVSCKTQRYFAYTAINF